MIFRQHGNLVSCGPHRTPATGLHLTSCFFLDTGDWGLSLAGFRRGDGRDGVGRVEHSVRV